MLIVGLTGGIGSGKTTVAKQFEALGVPIYIADKEAKQLMHTSSQIKEALINLFGNNAYIDDVLNRSYIASLIFNDNVLLAKMNAIIHPKVADHFKNWLKKQKSPYVIKEVAILFENGGYKNVDKIITVTAPKEERIKRVMKRDGSSLEKVLAIMKNQWSDEDKIKLSDFVIENLTISKTNAQVLKIHQALINN